jgi:AcrR family transcriptional regulator
MKVGDDGANARPTGTDQRERLLSVAAQLFAERGYHGTGVADLGRALSLGRGALYHHMGSKEALLADIVSRHVREMVDFGECVLAEDGEPVDKLRKLSTSLIRTISDRLPEVIVFHRETDHLRGEARSEVLALRNRYEAIWAQVLEEGAQDGSFRMACQLMVKGVLGMHNYSAFWIDSAGSMSPEEIADAFCDLLLGGLAAQP